MNEPSKEYIQALIKVKKVLPRIPKDKTNRFHKSRYAALDDILDAVESVLLEHGFVVMQPTKVIHGNDLGSCKMLLDTILFYAETGEQISAEYLLPDINDSQKMGSAITYARRYALQALLSLVPDDDDDGNAASGNSNGKTSNPHVQRSTTPKPEIVESPTLVDQIRLQRDRLGWDNDELKERLSSMFPGYTTISSLTAKQQQEALNKLQAM